jgi:hypothetical protein
VAEGGSWTNLFFRAEEKSVGCGHVQRVQVWLCWPVFGLLSALLRSPKARMGCRVASRAGPNNHDMIGPIGDGAGLAQFIPDTCGTAI